MTTQPEALRLAELLDCSVVVSDQQAAAELRRLYNLLMDQQGEIYALKMARSMEQKTAALKANELERCKTTLDATAECWRLDAKYWKDQRDALLEALKVVIDDLMYKDHARVIDVARAAIATVEGEKT